MSNDARAYVCVCICARVYACVNKKRRKYDQSKLQWFAAKPGIIGFFASARRFGTTVNRFLDENELWPGTSTNQNEK